MRRLAIAVLIVLFTFSTALPGICSQSEPITEQREAQPLADWGVDSGFFNDLSQTFVVVGEPQKHVVADLDNDSRPDIAVIYNGSSRIDIFYSDPDDRFNYSDRTTIYMPGPLTDFASGDVDKDLLIDLVVSCNVTGNDVFVLSQANGFNQTTPIFAMPSTSKPRALLLEDFDGDSWLDIATLFYADVPPYQPGFEVRMHSENYELNMLPIGLGSAPLSMQRPSLFISGNFDLSGQTDVIIGDGGMGKVIGYVNGAASGKVWDTFTNTISVNDPSAMRMEQLDGTGDMELIVAEEGTSKIKIWRCSSGAFALYTDVEEQASITSLTTIDVNSDSRLDLVSTSSLGQNLTVFRASASILYGHSDHLAFPTPNQPVHVVAHDMDASLYGTVDLIVSSRSSPGFGAISIYYRIGDSISNADGNRIVKDLSPTSMTLGNFNGDEHDEIAAYDPTGPALSFLDESSSLGRLSVPSGILAMESGDLDGDGFDDIAMMSESNVTVWFGSANIFSGVSRQVMMESTLPALSSLLLDDLNHDGRADLAVGGSDGMDVFWSSGAGNLYSEDQHFTLSLPGASVTSLATVLVQGTVHNDPRADLVIVNSTASRMEIYYQQTAGSIFTVSSSSYLRVIPGLFQMRVGDLNSDGLGDLAVLSPGKVQVHFQNPNYSRGFSDSQPISVIDVPEGPDQLEMGDLDDDGGPDLAMVSENSTLMAYGHDGSSFSLLTVQTTGAAPVLLSAWDMNADLKVDLVAYSASSLAVSFYHQNNLPPIAQAAVEGTGHLEGDPVWFNANGSTDSFSDRDRLSYDWDFDDGAVGSGERVSNVFQADGAYNVTLRVSDDYGGWDEAVVQVVIGDRSPTADFTFQTVPAPVEGYPLTFTVLSSTPADPIEHWEWDFGDGTWSNRTDDRPVPHVFGWNGTFDVTLTVIDSDGSSDSVSKQVLVHDSGPSADFQVSIASPLEGQQVAFYDISEFTADAIVSWKWNLGDGAWHNQTSNATLFHTYVSAGTYNVTLTVTDLDGSVGSVTRTMVVRNSVPTADFSLSIASPLEGQEVQFIDHSTVEINRVVSWSWDMGDGASYDRTDNSTVMHVFLDNGTYLVTLIVVDDDGDVHSASKAIVVRDTNPVITGSRTADGTTSFKEWDEINFLVAATPDYEAIVKYQWSFSATAFQVDGETTLGSTYHRYNSSGTYQVTVRVWDSDSYAEASIVLTITDPAPVPDFASSITEGTREVRLSAALTEDTENDRPWLLYRWFFGDGAKTDWGFSYEVDHTYQQDGVYSVRLEVKDDHNSPVQRTRNVTVDLLPPVISITDPVLKAEVGKPILVRVNVTDLVGIGTVTLEYTIDNVTIDMTMTSEGGNTYFAQIPALNRTGEISCQVIAEDRSGHVSATDPFTITVEHEDPTLFMLTSAFLLAALIVLLIYLFLSRPIVDEVFVMYHDGTLLAHQTRRLKPGMDDEILGGMLIALQNFVRDSFKDESSTVLSRMDFGERKLLVERKDDFFMAVVLSGKRAGNAPQRMLRVLNKIEDNYASVLREWDGDLEKVRGIRDDTRPIFQRTNPLDRLKRKEGD